MESNCSHLFLKETGLIIVEHENESHINVSVCIAYACCLEQKKPKHLPQGGRRPVINLWKRAKKRAPLSISIVKNTDPCVGKGIACFFFLSENCVPENACVCLFLFCFGGLPEQQQRQQSEQQQQRRRAASVGQFHREPCADVNTTNILTHKKRKRRS